MANEVYEFMNVINISYGIYPIDGNKKIYDIHLLSQKKNDFPN